MGEGVTQLQVGAGVGTGGDIDGVILGVAVLGRAVLLSAAGTFTGLTAWGVGDVCGPGLALPGGNAAGGVPGVSNESKPPVNTRYPLTAPATTSAVVVAKITRCLRPPPVVMTGSSSVGSSQARRVRRLTRS